MFFFFLGINLRRICASKDLLSSPQASRESFYFTAPNTQSKTLTCLPPKKPFSFSGFDWSTVTSPLPLPVYHHLPSSPTFLLRTLI
jgi:hypothetical protein